MKTLLENACARAAQYIETQTNRSVIPQQQAIDNLEKLAKLLDTSFYTELYRPFLKASGSISRNCLHQLQGRDSMKDATKMSILRWVFR